MEIAKYVVCLSVCLFVCVFVCSYATTPNHRVLRNKFLQPPWFNSLAESSWFVDLKRVLSRLPYLT